MDLDLSALRLLSSKKSWKKSFLSHFSFARRVRWRWLSYRTTSARFNLTRKRWWRRCSSESRDGKRSWKRVTERCASKSASSRPPREKEPLQPKQAEKRLQLKVNWSEKFVTGATKATISHLCTVTEYHTNLPKKRSHQTLASKLLTSPMDWKGNIFWDIAKVAEKTLLK